MENNSRHNTLDDKQISANVRKTNSLLLRNMLTKIAVKYNKLMCLGIFLAQEFQRHFQGKIHLSQVGQNTASTRFINAQCGVDGISATGYFLQNNQKDDVAESIRKL